MRRFMATSAEDHRSMNMLTPSGMACAAQLGSIAAWMRVHGGGLARDLVWLVVWAVTMRVGGICDW